MEKFADLLGDLLKALVVLLTIAIRWGQDYWTVRTSY